jgi:uncharacterized protein
MRAASRSLIAMLLAVVQAIAWAQGTPDAGLAKRRETAEQVMRLAGMDKMLDVIAAQLMTSMGPLMEAALRGRGAPEAERKEFVARFPGNFAAEFQSPEIRRQFNDAVLDVYAADYTQEELDALLAFYSTPVAQKMVARQAAQMQQIAGKARQIGETAGRRAALRTLEQMGIQR